MDVCNVVGNDIKTLLGKYSPESEVQKAAGKCTDAIERGKELLAQLADGKRRKSPTS